MARDRIAQLLFASAMAALSAQPVGQAQADIVTDWNVIALNATAVPPNSILQSRALAIVHGAIYDAVTAVDRKGAAYAVDLKAPPGTSVDAAAAAAAHRALALLVPEQLPMLDSALNASLSKVPDGQGKTDGVRIGSQIAEAVLRAFFGSDEVNVSVTFPSPFGVTRIYRRFSEMTEEVDNARVWGGIHFRSADRDGSEIGRRIGTIVMRDFPKAASNQRSHP